MGGGGGGGESTGEAARRCALATSVLPESSEHFRPPLLYIVRPGHDVLNLAPQVLEEDLAVGNVGVVEDHPGPDGLAYLRLLLRLDEARGLVEVDSIQERAVNQVLRYDARLEALRLLQLYAELSASEARLPMPSELLASGLVGERRAEGRRGNATDRPDRRRCGKLLPRKALDRGCPRPLAPLLCDQLAHRRQREGAEHSHLNDAVLGHKLRGDVVPHLVVFAIKLRFHVGEEVLCPCVRLNFALMGRDRGERRGQGVNLAHRVGGARRYCGGHQTRSRNDPTSLVSSPSYHPAALLALAAASHAPRQRLSRLWSILILQCQRSLRFAPAVRRGCKACAGATLDSSFVQCGSP